MSALPGTCPWQDDLLAAFAELSDGPRQSLKIVVYYAVVTLAL